MNYDLQVWTVDEPFLGELLPESAGWENKDLTWIYESTNWSVILYRSLRVLAEDLPAEVQRSIAGVAYLTNVHLSPFKASDDAKKLLYQTGFLIAKQAKGIILDPQFGIVVPTSGVPRRYAREPEKEATLIALSWWFLEGPLVQERRVDLFLDILESELPEALPRRYGSG